MIDRLRTFCRTSVFSGRNFRLVFFGALVSDIGAMLYSFAVSFYILQISGSNAFLQGIYLAVCGVASLLASPVGGVLGDRYNKAKIMYLCDFIKGGLILIAMLGLLLFPSAQAHIVILFITGLLGNAVSGIFSPVAGALLPDIVEEDSLQQANAFYAIKQSLQNIFGVVLAGILYALIPIAPLFLIVGLCYLLSGVSETFIRYEHHAPADRLTVRGALTDMLDGLRYVRAQKALTALIIAIVFINFFIYPVLNNFVPYFVKTDVAGAPSYLFDSYLTPELWSSAFSMLIGVSTLFGSLLLSGRNRSGRIGRKTAVRLCVVSGILIVCTAGYRVLVDRGVSLNAFLLLFSACCLLIGLLIAFINIPVDTAIMRITERNMLSKVGSIISISSHALIPLASVLAGLVLQYAGSFLLLCFCCAGFSVSAIMLLLNRAARDI